MTLVALTQEPEVKVRLAMIGRWCLPACMMLTDGESGSYCILYGDEHLTYEGGHGTWRGGPEYLRCPACIAAHGGAE
jgi:hypothetical protein